MHNLIKTEGAWIRHLNYFFFVGFFLSFSFCPFSFSFFLVIIKTIGNNQKL